MVTSDARHVHVCMEKYVNIHPKYYEGLMFEQAVEIWAQNVLNRKIIIICEQEKNPDT